MKIFLRAPILAAALAVLAVGIPIARAVTPANIQKDKSGANGTLTEGFKGGAHTFDFTGSTLIGITGGSGNTLIYGTGAPSGGNDGDSYIDIATGSFYKKSAGSWATPQVRFDLYGAAATVQAFAIQRGNHTGTQSADTITDGTTNKAYTATEKTKLSGIAAGATANSSDATLLARANHTGSQLAATISDFSAATLLAAQASLDLKANLALSTNSQTGTTYTFAASDAGKIVTLNNASAITATVPLNSVVNLPVGTRIWPKQLGAGAVTYAAAGGVTITPISGTLCIGAAGHASSLLKTATDTWELRIDMLDGSTAADPTTSADASLGYQVGSTWRNTSSGALWWCTSNTTSSAAWTRIDRLGSAGDFSSNTSSSVDGEIVLFSGTGGKTGKRATGSGIPKITSGVFGTGTAGTDYGVPILRQTFSNVAASVTAPNNIIEQIGSLSASRTLTLGAASGYVAGDRVVIADVSGSVTTTNTIVIARAGSDTINGASTSQTLDTAYGTMVLETDGTSKWTIISATGRAQGEVPLTDGATITQTMVPGIRSQNARVTLGGNRTLAFSGLVAGMEGNLRVIQDGTGSRTLALPGSSRVNGSATTVTLLTAAAAENILSWYTPDGTNIRWTNGTY